MRKVNLSLKDPRQAEERCRILAWTYGRVKDLGLKPRTMELVLLLLDNFWMRGLVHRRGTQKFCIKCAVLVINYEGDLCQGLLELTAFMEERIGGSCRDLWRTEVALFAQLPEDFASFVGFCEAVHCLARALELTRVSERELARFTRTAIQLFISGALPVFSFEALLLLPLARRHFPSQQVEANCRRVLDQTVRQQMEAFLINREKKVGVKLSHFKSLRGVFGAPDPRAGN